MVKDLGSTKGRLVILANLCLVRDVGIPGGGVKSVEIGKNTKGEGRHLDQNRR